jgi:hypothetical protein
MVVRLLRSWYAESLNPRYRQPTVLHNLWPLPGASSPHSWIKHQRSNHDQQRTPRPDAGITRDGDAAGTVGRDTSGPTTDDAMTRSEERLNVGTERQATGRARLRKYVTTENVTLSVPVQREEVRIEREPITDANPDAALSGPELSEVEHRLHL